ncbi:MAG: hypothetical protein HN350_04195 [Phycisphaerales bacterium]|jgi:hypothetical protein|nr:hypothetical protein [Phycisphaerales bacterium]
MNSRKTVIIISIASLMLMLTPCSVYGAAASAVSAGTGYSELTDATQAGIEAATEAKKALGDVKPKLVLVFALSKDFDQAKALTAVNAIFNANIVYGSAGYNSISEKGNAGTLSVLALGGEISVTPTIADVKEKDFAASGKQIGLALQKAAQVKQSGKLVLLLGDCHVPANDKVVQGVAGVIGKTIPIVGGAATGGQMYFKGKIAGANKNMGILITGDFLVGCSTVNTGPASIHPNKVVAAAGLAMKNAVGKNLKQTALVFAFDCGGRRVDMGKDKPDELKVMQAVIGTKTPLIGVYGSGEMGPKAAGQPSAGVGHHIAACAIINK